MTKQDRKNKYAKHHQNKPTNRNHDSHQRAYHSDQHGNLSHKHKFINRMSQDYQGEVVYWGECEECGYKDS